MTRLTEFAGELIALSPQPGERERLGIHLADSAGAFRLALTTREGRALLAHAAALAGGEPLGLVPGIAGAIRLTEVDDINLAACVTPSAAIVPAALAVAEQADCPPERFAAALMQGYEAMVRLGIALGGARALGPIWPSLFAAPFGAAAAAARALGLDTDKTAHALALALASSQGRPGQPVGPLPGRWLLFGESVGRGLRAAMAARAGFSGALKLLDGDWLADASGIAEADLLWFDRGERAPAAMALSIKPFCTARQAANAVVAFRTLQADMGPVNLVSEVVVEVAPIHFAMVTRPVQPGARLGTIANVAQQIAIAALSPDTLWDIERAGAIPPERQQFADKVRVVANPELESYLPNEWAARVSVSSAKGSVALLCRAYPGDPSQPLDLAGLQQKYAKNRHWDEAASHLLASAPAALGDRAARRSLWQAFEAGMNEPATS